MKREKSRQIEVSELDEEQQQNTGHTETESAGAAALKQSREQVERIPR